MAEPSTVTAASATLLSGVALASILPHIDANAAFGAIVGAALVASTKKDVSPWTRLLSFLFSALCGYGGAGEFVARQWAMQTFLPALLVSLVSVAIALKLVAVASDLDPGDIRAYLVKLMGGRQ